MKKINLNGIKTKLSREQMKKISGGYGCCQCSTWDSSGQLVYYTISAASGCNGWGPVITLVVPVDNLYNFQ